MNNFVASIKKVYQNFYFPADVLNITWAVLYNILGLHAEVIYSVTAVVIWL